MKIACPLSFSFVSRTLLTFQESVAHLQLLEEEVVENHKNLVDNMEKWLEQDASLLAMTNEVDYDQDGEI